MVIGGLHCWLAAIIVGSNSQTSVCFVSKSVTSFQPSNCVDCDFAEQQRRDFVDSWIHHSIVDGRISEGMFAIESILMIVALGANQQTIDWRRPSTFQHPPTGESMALCARLLRTRQCLSDYVHTHATWISYPYTRPGSHIRLVELLALLCIFTH